MAATDQRTAHAARRAGEAPAGAAGPSRSDASAGARTPATDRAPAEWLGRAPRLSGAPHVPVVSRIGMCHGFSG